MDDITDVVFFIDQQLSIFFDTIRTGRIASVTGQNWRVSAQLARMNFPHI